MRFKRSELHDGRIGTTDRIRFADENRAVGENYIRNKLLNHAEWVRALGQVKIQKRGECCRFWTLEIWREGPKKTPGAITNLVQVQESVDVGGSILCWILGLGFGYAS